MDRRKYWNYLNQSGLCDILKQNNLISRNVSSLASYNYTLLPLNASVSYYWATAMMYHVPRLQMQADFDKLSTVHDVSQRNLKVIKALCIKGNVTMPHGGLYFRTC